MRIDMLVVAPLVAVMLTLAPALAAAPDPFTALGAERPNELRTAPVLVLPGLDGRIVTLPKDFHGKAVLLSFFTTT